MFVRRALFSLLLVILLGVLVDAQDARTEPSPAPTASSVTLGILVDCSGTQRLQLESTLSAVKQLSETVTESDRAFLVRFVDAGKFSIIQEFTNNKDEINDSGDGLYIEGGMTAIIDAVDRSARYVAKNEPNSTANRAFVLISDGEDQGSGKKIEDTIALLKENQIRVFAIGISDLKVSTRLLDRFSKETGGRTFTPRTTAEMSNAVLTIAKLMRGAAAAK
jgi:VWFA-related protein